MRDAGPSPPGGRVPALTARAARAGSEGTVCELAHGHGMRRCRCRGQPRARLRHALTAIAVQHSIQRLRSWRAVS
ncbi:MAG TPA: transposase [Trebonia sp.]